jgi:5-formyltetrahydrofolate cyclo-ligase
MKQLADTTISKHAAGMNEAQNSRSLTCIHLLLSNSGVHRPINSQVRAMRECIVKGTIYQQQNTKSRPDRSIRNQDVHQQPAAAHKEEVVVPCVACNCGGHRVAGSAGSEQDDHSQGRP